MKFTYPQYESTFSALLDRVKTFEDARCSGSGIVVRHDVEFSVRRAINLMMVEKSIGIRSHYFFQVLAQSYNLAALRVLKDLQSLLKSEFFNVGLHLYISHLEPGDRLSLYKEVKRQANIFEEIFGFSPEWFSFHRPPPWVLEPNFLEINGIKSTYHSDFFPYHGWGKETQSKAVYIADSRRTWAYGSPDQIDSQVAETAIIQILTHPDEWYEQDISVEENFEVMCAEIVDDLKQNFSLECSHYRN